MVNNIHSFEYAQTYLQSHGNSSDVTYRMNYWNHLFINQILNKDKTSPTHLLEEGGGTCGIWNLLQFDSYSSADISTEMTQMAQKLHGPALDKTFITGDIFTPGLVLNFYTAIIANAFGVYYRPNLQSLQRLYDLLSPGGMVFVAIDPLLNIKHYVLSPFAGLINKHYRRYTRLSSRTLEKMAKQAGFKVWLKVTYFPVPGWERQAFILIK